MSSPTAEGDPVPSAAVPGPSPPATPEELYLDLLKRALTRSAFGRDMHLLQPPANSLAGRAYRPVQALLRRLDLRLVRSATDEQVADGRWWPTSAQTMLGQARLDNIQQSVTQVLRDGIPGDLIETGVWRGGGTILMRGVLKAYGDEERAVWVADSFQGLPKPDADAHPSDAGDEHWQYPELAVSLDDVRANFERYGLLDDQVRFLPGWFADTLPTAPIDRLAVLRLDGDMYGSTIDPLRHLYSKVAPGGFVIVDDYSLPGCRQAVDEFRAEHAIDDPLVRIDWTAVYWRTSG